MKQFGTVAIIGVGLIGSSIGLAIRQRRLARHVVGFDSLSSHLRQARRLRAIDAGEHDFGSWIGDSSVVFVCTPVDSVVSLVRRLAPHCRPGTLITDVASVKSPILREFKDELGGGVHFVGGHPLAGSDKNGPAAASPALFEGRPAFVVPPNGCPAAVVRQAKLLWRRMGAEPFMATAEDHDRIVASVSHLPHLVAAALAGATEPDYLKYASSGFQDTTRVAGGDPELWAQILLANTSDTLQALARFEKVVDRLRTGLEKRHGRAVREILAAAQRNTKRNALGS